MNLKRLEEIIIKNDYSAFRLKQVKKQVFARVISDWDEATDLPEKLRGGPWVKWPPCERFMPRIVSPGDNTVI